MEDENSYLTHRGILNIPLIIIIMIIIIYDYYYYYYYYYYLLFIIIIIIYHNKWYEINSTVLLESPCECGIESLGSISHVVI